MTAFIIIIIIAGIAMYAWQARQNSAYHAKIIDDINKQAQKACEAKKMNYNPLQTSDYKTFTAQCFTKSPFKNYSIQVKS